MGKQSNSYDLERAKCYMENYLSKNVMASGLAKYCKIYLFYNSDSPELQDLSVRIIPYRRPSWGSRHARYNA